MGASTPPRAPRIGRIAWRMLVSSPAVISYLISRPTSRKNTAMKDVVDDVRERHLTMEGADADGDLRMPELEEGAMRRRVGDDERDDGGKEP